MINKLTRFRAGMPISEAAKWLSELIDESVSEDDLIELHIDGHIAAGICGPFLGVRVEQPSNGGGDSWPVVCQALGNVPDRLYADALYEPLRLITTDMGEAPAHMVNGVAYAWFVEPYYSENQLSISEVIPNLVPIDLDKHLAVHPEDILRVADLANSIKPNPESKAPIRENRVVRLGPKDEADYYLAQPMDLELSRGARVAAKGKRETNTPLTVISVLLEMLSKNGRAARNQSSIIGEILELHADRRGLSQRNLEALFSAANKAFKSAR